MLWIGNDELVNFAPLDPATVIAAGGEASRPIGCVVPGPTELTTKSDEDSGSPSPPGGRSHGPPPRWPCCWRPRMTRTRLTRSRFSTTCSNSKTARSPSTRCRSCAAPQISESIAVRRRAFQALATSEVESRYRQTLTSFLDRGAELLDSETISVLRRSRPHVRPDQRLHRRSGESMPELRQKSWIRSCPRSAISCRATARPIPLSTAAFALSSPAP